MIAQREILKNIYQIWYDEQTRRQCWADFTLYHNPTLSPFFENAVIYHILSHPEKYPVPLDSYFGVLSPKFGYKAKGWMMKGPSPKELTEFLNNSTEDVLSFFRRETRRNTITQAPIWHKNFAEIYQLIIEKAGIDYDINRLPRVSKQTFSPVTGPQEITSIIFSNYVIAKYAIYRRYFKEVLKPCMDVMETDEQVKELIWQDSGYRKNRLTQTERRRFKESLGVEYYPYHTFICERFWTMFLNMNEDITFKHF